MKNQTRIKQVMGIFLAIFFGQILFGCSFVRSLRSDLDEEEKPNSPSDLKSYYDGESQGSAIDATDLINRTGQRYSYTRGLPAEVKSENPNAEVLRRTRVTKNDFFEDSVKNENSLWQGEGQQNYFFSKNSLRNPGDIVTVVVEDDLKKDMTNEVRKILPEEYKNKDIQIPGFSAAQTKTEKPRNPAGDQTAGATPPETAVATPSMPTVNAGSDTIQAEVIERYSNGNLRIRGVRRVPFKYHTRFIEVTGFVKSADIDDKDTVRSSKIFDNRVALYK